MRFRRAIARLLFAAGLGAAGCNENGLPTPSDASPDQIAASCGDGARNGGETDVDCGGEACGPCADGQACLHAVDCRSGVCEGRRCAPANCNDSVQNGDESDVDCGGPSCPACADGRLCRAASDCRSTVCAGGRCLPEVSFEPMPVPLDGIPWGIAAADLDGDGAPDLAVADEVGELLVLLNRGAKGFAPPAAYPAGSVPFQVRVADLDADGHPDLVVANNGPGGGATVLAGQGAGRFGGGTHVDTSPPEGYAFATAIADLDGDGHLDLAAANQGVNTVSYQRGDGTGRFGAPTTLAFPGASMLLAADLDGDGHPDLASVSNLTGKLGVSLNDGAGGFPPFTLYQVSPRQARSLAVGDLNRDGHPDLVEIDIFNGAAVVTKNDGHGGFGAPVRFPAGPGARWIELGDLDGDGNLDAVVGDASAAQVAVLRGRGDGTLRDALFFPVAQTVVSLALADFDRDGRLDVAAVIDTVGVVVLRNTSHR